MNCKRRKGSSGGNAATGWILNIGSCKCGDEVCVNSSDKTAETAAAHAATADGDPNSETETFETESAIVTQEEVPKFIDDRFEVLSVLGKGGMGTVYKVRDQQVGSIFALKLLHQNLQSDPSVLKRFEQEAKAAEQLDHPNLVPTYAHGITKNGEPYLLIEYVEGETLAQIIEREGALEEDRAISIFEQICAALSYAHEMKIVHRDIKPANIIVSKAASGEEVVRVVDFGIAKTLTEVDRSTRNLTQTGEVFGSPHYMSPEQCLGLMLDEKSDIYSLGCVMYEALSGKPPFAGSNPIQLVVKHINDPPTPYLPKIAASRKSKGLQSIALKCLSKEASFRFEKMDEIVDAIGDIKEGRKVTLDHNFAIQTAKFERSMQKIAISMPLIFVTAIFAVSLISLLPSLTEAIDERFVLSLGFGIYTAIAVIISSLSAVMARSCLGISQGKHNRAMIWSAWSLTFCAALIAGTIPASLFLLSSARLYAPPVFELPLWDWLTVAGLTVTFLSGIAVLLSCLWWAIDRQPTKVSLENTLWKLLVPGAVVFVVLGFAGQSQIGYVLGRMGYWFTKVPTKLTSGANLKLTEYARFLAPRDLYVLSDSAEVAFEEGQNEEAIRLFSKYLSTYRQAYPTGKNWTHAIYCIGVCYKQLGEFERAVKSFTELVDSPDSGADGLNAIDDRADCYMSLHKPAEAIRDYNTIIQTGRDSFHTHLKKAIALEALGDLEGALAALEPIDRGSTSKQVGVYVNEGYIYELEGDYSSAQAAYRRGLDLTERNENWNLIGKTIAAIQLNDDKSAKEHFTSLKNNCYFQPKDLPEMLYVYPPALRQKAYQFIEMYKLL